jgi:hypothetical protein
VDGKRIMKRITILAVGALMALGFSAGPALAKPNSGNGTSAQISATFSCTSVDVSSSMDISNVVLAFADGSTQKFEGTFSEDETFAGTGANAGKTITTAWVKSGANLSGDGSGYGERFDSDAVCTTVDNDPGSNDPGSNDPGSNDPGSNDPGSNDPGSNDPGSNDPGSNDPGSGGGDTGNDGTPVSGDTSVEGNELNSSVDDASAASPTLDIQSSDVAVLGGGLSRSAVLGAETLPVSGGAFDNYLVLALTSIVLGGALLRRGRIEAETI